MCRKIYSLSGTTISSLCAILHNTCISLSLLSLPLCYVLQNVVVTYAGMLFGDYIFDAYNFVGINVRLVNDITVYRKV